MEELKPLRLDEIRADSDSVRAKIPQIASVVGGMRDDQIGALRYVRRDDLTLLFARQLTQLEANVLRQEYPEFRARSLVPITPVGATTEHVVYRQIEEFAEPAKIADYHADTQTTVSMRGQEFSNRVVGFQNGYMTSIMDLRRAAEAQVALEMEYAGAARRGMEHAFDRYWALGHPQTGQRGFLTQPVDARLPVADQSGVAHVTRTNLPGYSGEWDDTTDGEVILEALDLIVSVAILRANTVAGYYPDTLAMPVRLYEFLSRKRYNQFDSTRVIDKFMQGNRRIRAVEEWNLLDEEQSGIAGGRMVLYRRDPMAVRATEGQPFEQLPVQARGLGFYTQCHGRAGGVEVKMPISMSYIDGALPDLA